MYDDVVCPVTSCPPRSHWIVCCTPDESQVGAALVRVLPTRGVPWMDGGVVADGAGPSTAVIALLSVDDSSLPGSSPMTFNVIDALRSPGATV